MLFLYFREHHFDTSFLTPDSLLQRWGLHSMVLAYKKDKFAS